MMSVVGRRRCRQDGGCHLHAAMSFGVGQMLHLSLFERKKKTQEVTFYGCARKSPSSVVIFLLQNRRVYVPRSTNMTMSVAASISSIAAVRFPNCRRRCFRSSPSLSLPIMSQFSSSSSATSPPPSSSVAAPVEAKEPPKLPWLIVGLGNPGKKYSSTRHNVGFEMVDAIAEAEGIALSSVSFRSLIGKGFIGDSPVIFTKPQTYMNKSGESVGAIVSYYQIPLQQVLVIFDDLDLPFAKLRLLPKGGHGGQNGMRSIIDHFKGSRDFPRLRIGIGRPPGKMDPANFVLRPFTKQEREEFDFTFQHGTDAVRILLLEGFNKAATFVNTAKPLEQCG